MHPAKQKTINLSWIDAQKILGYIQDPADHASAYQVLNMDDYDHVVSLEEIEQCTVRVDLDRDQVEALADLVTPGSVFDFLYDQIEFPLMCERCEERSDYFSPLTELYITDYHLVRMYNALSKRTPEKLIPLARTLLDEYMRRRTGK